MSSKHIFVSLLLSLLYFENSQGNYLNGDGYQQDLFQMRNHRYRRSLDDMPLQHPLRFRSSLDDRKYLLKPPMHARRTLPFQLVTQPKTSAFIEATEGRSYPIHFPSMDAPYQRGHGIFKMGSRISDLRKENTLDDFTAELEKEELNEDKLPPMPTSSAVTSKSKLSPSDLLSMLRGYSVDMDNENERNRMRFGLF